MRRKHWFAMLIVAFAFQGGLHAATEPPAGIDALWAYAGDWKIQIDRFDTANSKAGHETTHLHNACWKNGAYVACNQYVDGDSKVLIVFTYSAKEKIYTSYQIPQDGGQAGSGKLIIEGNVWTFPWQVTQDNKTTYFRVVNVFAAPDRIEYRQEFSEDKVNWTVMAKGVETKLSSE